MEQVGVCQTSQGILRLSISQGKCDIVAGLGREKPLRCIASEQAGDCGNILLHSDEDCPRKRS